MTITPAMIFLVVWGIAWLLVLATVLGRHDLDPVTRLTWVIVVIVVPFFGLLLYAITAPARLDAKKIHLSNDVSGTPWENNPGYTAKSGSNKP